MKNSRKVKGFTLFEVLIALAIVAIALATLVKAARANASNAAYLRDKTFAQWVAVNKLTEWRYNKEFPATSDKKGHDLMGGHDWYWHANIKRVKVDNQQYIKDGDLRQIEFRVFRSEQERDADELPVYRLNTYIVRVNQ